MRCLRATASGLLELKLASRASSRFICSLQGAPREKDPVSKWS
jgi:hypothetical protein